MSRFIFVVLACIFGKYVVFCGTQSISEFEEGMNIYYQVSIRFKKTGMHHCSGSAISLRYLLTAGHCVCNYYKYHLFYVVLGALHFRSNGEIYELEDAICHEKFSYTYLRNDIALLKTVDDIEFNDKVHRASIGKFKIPIGATLYLGQWNFNTNLSMQPRYFRYMPVKLIDINQCARMHSLYMVTQNNICTLTRDVGACIGDSGGPLMYLGLLVGLISFGTGCSPGKSNVHLKLSEYTGWIESKIRQREIIYDSAEEFAMHEGLLNDRINKMEVGNNHYFDSNKIQEEEFDDDDHRELMLVDLNQEKLEVSFRSENDEDDVTLENQMSDDLL